MLESPKNVLMIVCFPVISILCQQFIFDKNVLRDIIEILYIYILFI